MTAVANSFSSGLTSFMTSSGIGIVPARMHALDVVWGAPGSLQEPIVPLLKMEEHDVCPVIGPSDPEAIADPLFTNWRNLRGSLSLASGAVHMPPARLRLEADAFESIGGDDAAAMLRELALDLVASSTQGDPLCLRERTATAKAWLVSLRRYVSCPANDRFKISRGLWYAWAEREASIYGPLLLMSQELYSKRGDDLMAASDQLRIALETSRDDHLDSESYGVIAEMIDRAVEMLANSWQQVVDLGKLRNLAEQASMLAEGGR